MGEQWHSGLGGIQPSRIWGSRLNIDRWVPYRSDARVRCRVFCFPHAGGNAAFYRPFRQLVPAGIDFCPVELPGRAARLGEPPMTDIDALLDTLNRTIQPLMNVPFAFFGHSIGAAVAYRAAQVLRAADGREAVHLFVSARAAPAAAAGETRHAPSAPSLSDDALRMLLQRFGGTPGIVLAREELVAALLPTLRADLTLGESCDGTGALLACPITAFGGTEDAIDSASHEAWAALTRGPFRLKLFAGGHFYLGGAAAALAQEIARELRAVAAGLEEAEA
jgi:medium-chain acyl-[acyl-carrier-protein] hydrolase